MNFGSVQVSKTSTLPLTLTNGQTTSVQVSNLAASGTGFNVSGFALPVNLSAGQSVTVNVNFTPPASGTDSGSATVTSNANNPSISIPLSGTGTVSGQLGANPTSLNFGSVLVNKTSTLSLTLTNGQTTTVQVSQLAASGTGFSVSGFTLPINLSAGQSVTVNVNFTPPASGTDNGSVTVTSNANNPSLSVSLTGKGASSGQLAVSPITLDFGTVNVGSTKKLTGTLSASSNSVTVSSASWNGPGFSVSGISFPVTLAAGGSLPFTVTFAPQTGGSATGLVSFVSNASNTPTNENLTGSGAQVTQHSVALSWNPNASTVQGYYVYRGGKSGGPYTKISALQAGTSYSDTTVASGTTYFYVVTALGTNSVESGYSNDAMATVP
jgi:predicted RNA-binding protein with TRAM domain